MIFGGRGWLEFGADRVQASATSAIDNGNGTGAAEVAGPTISLLSESYDAKTEYSPGFRSDLQLALFSTSRFIHAPPWRFLAGYERGLYKRRITTVCRQPGQAENA